MTSFSFFFFVWHDIETPSAEWKSSQIRFNSQLKLSHDAFTWRVGLDRIILLLIDLMIKYSPGSGWVETDRQTTAGL